jgi:hypothetical protein
VLFILLILTVVALTKLNTSERKPALQKQAPAAILRVI